MKKNHSQEKCAQMTHTKCLHCSTHRPPWVTRKLSRSHLWLKFLLALIHPKKL